MFLAGMNSTDRPIGSFPFLGPTGSGKTRIVEAAAETLCSSRAVIKIPGAEFQHSHEIAKLIGSLPGVIGTPRDAPAAEPGSAETISHEKIRLSFVPFDDREASDAPWDPPCRASWTGPL